MGSITTGQSGGGQRFINGFPVHPAAEVYPLMTGTQWEEFLDNVRKTMKVYEKIVFHEGAILEGRHRMTAVEIVERETRRKVEWGREEFDTSTGELPSDFVKRKNFHRRHMTPDQLAASAVKQYWQRERELSERRKKASQFGSKPDDVTATPKIESPPEVEESGRRRRNPTTAERIAADQGIKKHRVEKAVKILKEQGEDALTKVLNGDVSLNTALGSTKKVHLEKTNPEQAVAAEQEKPVDSVSQEDREMEELISEGEEHLRQAIDCFFPFDDEVLVAAVNEILGERFGLVCKEEHHAI